MPFFERDGVRLSYDDHPAGDGTGVPVLALAPGGMRSTASVWARAPWNPVVELAATHRVITMDQRNAGASTAPVTGREGWATYTSDQVALLDHLGIAEVVVVGMCIGGAFILGLTSAAPERIRAAVAMQPIGLEDNRDSFLEMFDQWADELRAQHPEAGPDAWAGYRARMYEGPDALFSVPDVVLPSITTPMLVLQGGDHYHPASASRAVAAAVPGAELVEQWKEPEHLPATRARITAFLAAHS